MSTQQAAYPLTTIERAALARFVRVFSAMTDRDRHDADRLNRLTSAADIRLTLGQHKRLATLALRYGVMTDVAEAIS